MVDLFVQVSEYANPADLDAIQAIRRSPRLVVAGLAE